MAQRTLQKLTSDPVSYYPNHRVIGDVNITVQNNTGAALTLQVSNSRDESPLYSDPAQGAVSIANGDIVAITDPYFVYQLSGIGTGDINIVEPY